MKKNILVTGANGLVGRHLSQRLVDSGFRVFGVTRALPSDPVCTVDYIVADFSSLWHEEVLPKQVDVIINLAQSEKFRDFPGSAIDVFKVNIDSLARLLNYASQTGVKQFIHTSSGGVYAPTNVHLTESHALLPIEQLGCYLGSKVCGEILIQTYAAIIRNIVVFRPFFIYGGNQKRGMLLPRLWDNVVAKRKITLQGPSGISINPVHVDDLINAIFAAFDIAGSLTVNIAGPEVLSIKEICEAMGEYFGEKPRFEYVDKKNDLIADISLMQKILIDPKRKLLDSLESIATVSA